MRKNGTNNGKQLHLYGCEQGFPFVAELPLRIRQARAFAFSGNFAGAARRVWGGGRGLECGSFYFCGAEKEGEEFVEKHGGL